MSNKKKDLPPGWKTHSIGDVLGKEHLSKFVEMMDRLGGDMIALQKELNAYLQPFKAEFLARGFDVDYLSYALPYRAAQSLEAAREEHKEQTALDSKDIADEIMRQHKPKPNQWN
jgi:hypothetical protein